MNITERLIQVVKILDSKKVTYALAGGLVASIYRESERLTKDLDFLILAGPDSLAVAKEVIIQLGLTPHEVTDAQLAGGPTFKIKRKRGEIWMVVGRKEGDTENKESGVDFILPQMPWFQEALSRAQNLKINFGPVTIPTLSAEDIILSKLFAYKNDATRPYDVDDIRSIFKAASDFDLPYIAGQMTKHEIPIPKTIREQSPVALVQVSKAIERKARKRTRDSNKPFPPTL